MTNTRSGRTILLAEDDPEVRNYLEMALKCQGYSVEMADDGEEALNIFEQNPGGIAAVLLDIGMPHRDGLAALRDIRRLDPTLPVIMISGASSPVSVVEAMRNGANDFLGKPVTHLDLQKALRAALEDAAIVVEAPDAQTGTAKNGAFLSTNSYMKELQKLLPQIGASNEPALILGETGVGKEVLARQLHSYSPRSKRPFLKVNCAALPTELVESELFGYERGAFTGAFQRKPGKFELAESGTIFLDEIGDMDVKLQAKLLQVLQDHEFQRLGGKETVRVDVRVIAATHCNLERAIIQNTFRKDLYYRLNVITVRVPPLRERKEDIVGLAQFLLQKHSGANTAALLPAPLRAAMADFEWPGNIRELENIVRKLLVLRDPEIIIRELRNNTPGGIVSESRNSLGPAGESAGATNRTILEQVTKARDEAETQAIVAALESTHWNRKQAAKLLKIDYKALLYKMKKLDIDDRMATLPDRPGRSETNQ